MSKTFATLYAAFVAEAARNGFAVTLVPLTGKASTQQPKAAGTTKTQPKAAAKTTGSKPKASRKSTKLYARYCDAVGIEYPDIDEAYKASGEPQTRRDGKAISASTKCYWHHCTNPSLLGLTEPLSYNELDARV